MSQPVVPPQPFWQARTGTGLHPEMLDYSESLGDDLPFLVHDLAGSAAHVLGLERAGLLLEGEAASLLASLRAIRTSHEAGLLRLDARLEDIHMNIEARLTVDLGDVGRKLHTGRSRNDQVATCIVLYARAGLANMAQAAFTLSTALAAQARAHLETPWVARTHGQPAQPATLGFLLAAHAHRMLDVAEVALGAFHAVGESPLGCGAVAGSTLPLDPAYTSRLLGLRPPRNALLATGSRDAVVASCTVAARAGLVAASLATDLLALFVSGAMQLPEGYTSGSSLMPQKRNPDALELARANGNALQAPLATVTAILSGLGLGYQRDFQLTKPCLVAAMQKGQTTLGILTSCVAGGTFASASPAESAKPGLCATDVAEALVMSGMPFRTAYAAVAGAHGELEVQADDGGGSTGQSAWAKFAAALGRQGLSDGQLAAARAAMQPDAKRRDTLGGPAPRAVAASLDGFDAAAKELAQGLAEAQAAVETPLRLLDANGLLEADAGSTQSNGRLGMRDMEA